MKKTFTLKGWTVEDVSRITRGADPAQMTRYRVTGFGRSILIEEFFNDYFLTNERGERGGPFQQDLLDKHLVRQGFPTTKQIEAKLSMITSGDDPYFGGA
jgi:hypothetical protein